MEAYNQKEFSVTRMIGLLAWGEGEGGCCHYQRKVGGYAQASLMELGYGGGRGGGLYRTVTGRSQQLEFYCSYVVSSVLSQTLLVISWSFVTGEGCKVLMKRRLVFSQVSTRTTALVEVLQQSSGAKRQVPRQNRHFEEDKVTFCKNFGNC